MVTEKTPASPKHAPAAVTEYVPDIVAPEIVPVKLPISGELQLTAFPANVQPVTEAVEKQGEPLIVMPPEKAVSDCVIVMEKVPDEITLLLTQMPFQVSDTFGDA